MTTIQKWVTVKELSELHPCFPEGGIRNLIFKRKENGFGRCLRWLGKRKVLINLEEFEQWVESHAEVDDD